MTNEEFDEMIKAVFDRNPDFDLFGIELDFTPAKISRKTDRYIKKLSNEMFCSPSKAERKQRFRLRYFVAAIIGASILAGGAAAYNSKYIFTEGDKEMAYVSVESTIYDKTSIEEVYELTYELEGYKQTRCEVTEIDVDTAYTKGTQYIRLSQNLISNDDAMVNTENAIIETIDINGEEAIYIDSSDEYDDTQMLLWTYDGYEFFLSVNAETDRREFSKEQVIDMAKSIQIRN